jgi:hypothetical protein
MSTDLSLQIRYGTELERYPIADTKNNDPQNQTHVYTCDSEGNIFIISSKDNHVYAVFPKKPKPTPEKVSADKSKNNATSAIKGAKTAIQTATTKASSTDTLYGKTLASFRRLPKRSQKGSINPQQYSQYIEKAKNYIGSAQTELATANAHIKSGDTLYNERNYTAAKTHYDHATADAKSAIQNINKVAPLFDTVIQGCQKLATKIRAAQRTSGKPGRRPHH